MGQDSMARYAAASEVYNDDDNDNDNDNDNNENASSQAPIYGSLTGWVMTVMIFAFIVVWAHMLLQQPDYPGGVVFGSNSPQTSSKGRGVVHGVDVAGLRSVLSEIRSTKSRMCAMWPNNTNDCHILKQGWALNQRFRAGGYIQYTLAHKILQSVQNRQHGHVSRNLTISVTGSSTSAGHDTHFDYTYAQTVKQLNHSSQLVR